MRPKLRSRAAGRRLDLTAIREALKDQRVWACLGVVIGSEKIDEDLLVDVELQPSGEEITARMGTVGGSFGAGTWAVPQAGSEVAVMIPDGDAEFSPVVVASFASGAVPEDTNESDWLAYSKRHAVLLADDEVRLGSATASEAVVKGDSYASAEKAFIDALTTWRAALLTMLGGLDVFHGSALIGAYTTADTSLTTASTAFKTAVDAALSTKTKTD